MPQTPTLETARPIDTMAQNYAAMKAAMDAALLPANVAGWSDGARYWAISMMQVPLAGRGGSRKHNLGADAVLTMPTWCSPSLECVP